MLRRRGFLRGCCIGEGRAKDLAWFDPAGGEMTDTSWHAVARRSVGMRLDGNAMDLADVDARGHRIQDDTLFVLFNAGRRSVEFALPVAPGDGTWRLVFDTADEMIVRRMVDEGSYHLRAHTVAVLLTPGESGR